MVRGSAAWCSARPAWPCTTSSAVPGGSFNLPHAETHSIVLPHAVRYNQEAAPEAMARIARAIRAEDPRRIYDLEKSLGLPLRLADIGMKEGDLERAARIATEAPYPNPKRSITRRARLRNAYGDIVHDRRDFRVHCRRSWFADYKQCRSA